MPALLLTPIQRQAAFKSYRYCRMQCVWIVLLLERRVAVPKVPNAKFLCSQGDAFDAARRLAIVASLTLYLCLLVIQ